jgi:lysylphosphatidylglycerol synthetase-like protein (DUF2156 family)
LSPGPRGRGPCLRDSSRERSGRASDRPSEREPWYRRTWAKHARNGVIVAVLIAVAVLLGLAFVPRWWSHRIGDQVDASIGAGIGLGLLYGFVFTFLPLLVIWLAFRKRRPWRSELILLGFAVVLALPNLFTLGIVLGVGSGAHAGQRTFDVEAPAYRTSVLIGALAAAVVFAALWYLWLSRRHARRSETRLREELSGPGASQGDEPP